MKRSQFELAAMTSMIAVMVSMISILFQSFFSSSDGYTIFLTAFASSAMALYVSFVVRALNKNPTPLRAFVIGQPRAGKTVFLSILFDELQRLSVSGIAFQQYGSETVEKINSNLHILNTGNWIPRTELNVAFFYRARATVGSSFFKNTYTIEVGDYAGEHIREFDTSSNMWLHKSEYFKYALSSDALLFCIDGEILSNHDKIKIEESQAMLIAAFQMLLSEKTTNAHDKIKIPVCIVVLKSDLFINDDEIDQFMKKYYFRLTDLISKKSDTYQEFYISAVGNTQGGRPPSKISPMRVVDPMVWILKNTKL